MSTSRTNFKSMFLISENYLNELKFKQKEENATEEEGNSRIETSQPQPPASDPSPNPPIVPPTPTPANSNPTPIPSTPTPISLSEDEWTPNQEENIVPTSVVKTTDENETKLEKKIEDGQYETIEDKVNSYNCSICNEAFETKEDMLNHQTKNHPEHKCEACDKEFNSKRELDNHITESHERIKRVSNRLVRKRAREDYDDDDNNDENARISNRKKFKIRLTNKRNQEQNETPLPKSKKVKVQLQNVEEIKDIKQKERKKINESIGQQHKVEAISYPDSDDSLHCKICNKRFTSLFAYRDHTH